MTGPARQAARRGAGKQTPQNPILATLKASGATTDMGGVSKSPKTLLSPSARKYGNSPQIVDGQRFDSKKEAARYGFLRLMEQAGEIRALEVHPRFPLVVHDIDCGVYVADFAYLTRLGEPVVEDVKSAATRKLPTYRLKARLVWAIYGLRITEV